MPSKNRVLFLRLLRPLIHVALIGLVFWLMYELRLRTDLIPGIQLRIPPIVTAELWLYGSIAAVVFLLLGLRNSLYKLRGTPRYRTIYLKTWGSWFVAIVFVAYLGSDFVFSGGISRWIVIAGGLATAVVLSIFDSLWNTRIRHLAQAHPTRVLCIYRKDSQQDTVAQALDIRQYSLTWLPASQRHGYQDYTLYDMIVLVGDYSDEQLQGAFDQVRLGHQEFYHIPASGFLEDVVYEPTALESIHAFRCTPTRLDDWAIVFKRAFDIIGSLCGIVLLSPVMVAVAVAVRLDSPGPVIYRQQRVGKRGDLFTFLKFRSMYTHLSTGSAYGGEQAEVIEETLDHSDANARDGILSKIDNDPRVTRVGRFIRRTSLDELPQLFCVLWGTMSLVGPRPHLPKEVAKYESRHTRLFAIKPGITGYAQIFGRDSLSFDEEAELDLDYIQNWSIWLDVYAIIKTVGVVFRGR